jgi:AcrR family transcriptional regulator
VVELDTGTGADQRREQMLQAALAVIAERGFPETRIADVADRVGTSPALVIYYFKTKDNLLTEAMRYAEDTWYATVARRMEDIAGAAGRLEKIVAMTCLPDADLPDSWALWLDLWAQAVRHPEVARVRAEFDEHWRATIAEVVRQGQADGEFDDVDPDEFAVGFSALLDGFAVQIALDDPVVDADRAFDLSMRIAADRLGFPWSGRRGRPTGRKDRTRPVAARARA